MPLLVGLTTSPLAARELTTAAGVPSTHEAHAPDDMFHKVLPEMSGGDLTTRQLGMEVVNLGGALDALKNGITDVAQVLTLYTPAEFPNSVFPAELAALGNNGQVMMAAMTEYLVKCAECQAEFKKLGIVYTGNNSTTPYYLLTTKPVRTLADLKGLRLRSGGSPFSRWATSMGAVPVQMSTNDQYEAISNGLLDGTLNPPAALVGARLGEVVKYVTPLPIGTFHAAMGFIIRKDVWKDLSIKEREAFLKASAISDAYYVPNTTRLGEQGVTDGEKHGLEVLTPGQDLIDANDAFAANEVMEVAKIGEERYGIKNPEAKIATFQDLIAKWQKILDEAGYDEMSVGNAIYDEIWAKIDLSNYGQ